MLDKNIILYQLQHLKQIVFEVTDSCNLACEYCGYSHLYNDFDSRVGKTLPFYKARLIIDYLISIRDNSSDINYPLTIGFYGGEPLLNIPFIQQVITYFEQISDKISKVKYGMTTNAVLLDKYMDILVENNFRLLISLDGDEFNHSYRVDFSGKNSFTRVFKNIKLLQEKYPEYFNNSVQFSSVLHNRNNVESTYRFIKENFDKTPLISSLNTTGIRKDKISDFKRIYKNLNEDILQSNNCESIEAEMFIKTPRVQNLAKHIFKRTGNVFGEFNDLIFDLQQNSPIQTGTCIPFSKKMFITSNGKILQCERIGHHFSLGQIHDNHIELNLEEIAKKQNMYISKFSKQCNVCYLKNECPECVYTIDDIMSEKPTCPNFCNKERYDILCKKNTDYLKMHPDYYEKILNNVKI